MLHRIKIAFNRGGHGGNARRVRRVVHRNVATVCEEFAETVDPGPAFSAVKKETWGRTNYPTVCTEIEIAFNSQDPRPENARAKSLR